MLTPEHRGYYRLGLQASGVHNWWSVSHVRQLVEAYDDAVARIAALELDLAAARQAQGFPALLKPIAICDLMSAVEGVLAEFGVSGPGEACGNGDMEEPAAILVDFLYDRWNAAMREINGWPDATFVPARDQEVYE